MTRSTDPTTRRVYLDKATMASCLLGRCTARDLAPTDLSHDSRMISGGSKSRRGDDILPAPVAAKNATHGDRGQ